MTATPLFASGEGFAPLLLSFYLAAACVVGGLYLVIKTRKWMHRLLGAVLGLCGVTIAILSLVFFNKLVRLF
jgi:hypothetical protein